MSVMGVFGWTMAAAVAVLMGFLVGNERGRVVVAGALFLLCVFAFGYQWGHGDGAKEAAQVVAAFDERLCKIDFPRDVEARTIEAFHGQTLACTLEIRRVEIDAREVQLPLWVGFTSIIGAIATLLYLGYRADAFLRTRLQPVAVGGPTGEDQRAHQRPRKRRRLKTKGVEGGGKRR